jgi:hypothetical protein
MNDVIDPKASQPTIAGSLTDPGDVRLHDFLASAVRGLVRGLGKGEEVELNPQPEPPGIQASTETVVHQWTVGLTYTRYITRGSTGPNQRSESTVVPASRNQD